MSNNTRPVRRTRRKVSATHVDDVISLDSSSGDASPPIRRRRLNSDDPMEGSSETQPDNINTKRKLDAKMELAVRLMSQMRAIHTVKSSIASDRGTNVENGCQDESAVGIVGGKLTVGDSASIAIPVDTLLGSPVKKSDSSTRKHHARPVTSATEASLPPIEIKVEENSAASPSSSYLEQQPSTSTVAPLMPSSVASATAQSTPRSSSAAGVESNVERVAKQEAQVLARIAELRRQGLWTASRLPMIEMPPRNKTHWDYLLEEMRWMAIDFRQERNFKRQAAKKFAFQIARLIRDREQEKERAQQRAIREAKRVCALIAKMVRDFWQNVDKVVDLRAQEIIESMKRKALDQQLEVMVGHADKLSVMVQEGLIGERSSVASSAQSPDNPKDDDNASFSTDSDDDISISDTEAADGNVEEEMQGLVAEGNLELDDLLDSLPPEYLESISKSKQSENRFEPMQGTSTDDKRPEGSEVSTEYAASEIMPEEESTRHSASVPQSISSGTAEVVPLENTAKDALGSAINYSRLTSENSEERQKELANIAEEALKFQPKGFTLETTQVKTEVPHLIRGTLREYQMVGLDWLVTLYDNGLNGILADEMGLGKTIQTIALLAHLACKEYIWGPHLIIVPTSVILNWEMEFKKWCPAFKILTYFGNQRERAEKRKGWSKANAFHVCITSYKIVTQDIRSFKHKAWQYLVLDEAQNIKNFKSQRWQTLLNIRARRRLLLTGTPLQNSLMELWSLMHFLMPAIFASHNDFKDWFSNPLNDMMEGNAEWNASLIQRLHKVLRPFILRRLKSDVEKQLPEKTEHIIKCPLSKRQRCLYDDFMSRRTTRENLRSGTVMSVLNIVMQLRKCCNHPNLFEPRPILSPFVMQPFIITLPGVLFNICERKEIEETDLIDLFKISPICDSLVAYSEGRRLMVDEQLLNTELSRKPNAPMPKLGGFRFSRPPPRLQPQARERSKVFMPVPLPAAGIARGNELYVSVDDLGNARVYQLVTDSTGGQTVRECEPSSVVGNRFLVSGASASQRPSVAHSTRSATAIAIQSQASRQEPLKSEVKQGGTEPTTATVSSNVPFLRPAFRTTTVLSQTSSSVDSSTRGAGTVNNGCTSLPESHIATAIPINQTQQVKVLEPESIAVDGVRTAVGVSRRGIGTMEVDEVKPQTVTAKPVDQKSRAYDFLVLPNTSKVLEQMKAERVKYCAAACARRLSFPNVRRTPLVSDELLSVVLRELNRKKHRRYCSSTEESLKWLMPSLVDWTSDALKRFTVFVPGALVDEPVLQINSSGCYAYIRKERDDLDEVCRDMLLNVDGLVSEVDMMQKLQFPELRLIEYDCGKLQVLSVLLRDLFLYKHRCLIFTQMARVLDVLQAFLSFHGYQYFRLDGTTGIEQRQAMTERFNADPKIFCFILSTRSGGIGVNLTGADTVIFYDSDWNPTMDAQAQDRCHRIGQTRNVTIYRLISERTIEENILRKAMQKRRLGEMAIDEAGFTPEFFKGDNVRDLFEGDANVVDVIAPVAETDVKEIEKAMATVEDIQDVHAAQRANAEVEADIAEFDENALIPSVESNQEKIESKYLELINQLKPIERYAINFLEAEYKPEFEEEMKEAEAMIASKKDEWMKAQEDVMEEDDGDGDGDGEQQSDDEISLTYLSGFDVPGSVDEVRSKPSTSRLASLRPLLRKPAHSRNLRSTTLAATKTRSSPRLIRSKMTQSSSERTLPSKTVVTSTKTRKTADKNNLQSKSISDSNLPSLVSRPSVKGPPEEVSTKKPPEKPSSRQPNFDVDECTCARVVPISIALAKASAAARQTSGTTPRYSSHLPVVSINAPRFSLLPSTSSGSRPSTSSFRPSTSSFPRPIIFSGPRSSTSSGFRTSSRFGTFTSFSSSPSASYTISGGDRFSSIRRPILYPRPPAPSSSGERMQQLRTAPGPSRLPAHIMAVRSRSESGNFQFAKPVSSAYKSASEQQLLPGIRMKPMTGDYERPRLFLRKRGEPRSGEGDESSSASSNANPRNVSRSE